MSLTQSLDRIVFETPLVRAAHFKCDARDPRFRDTGPIENCIVVFPRTAVWIRHAGSRAFVADPSVSTIYNAGQEYTRKPISGDGDRCEWLAVSPSIAHDIAESVDESARDRELPFAAQWARIDCDLYLRQRAFFARLERGDLTSLEAEETIIGLVTSVIVRSYVRLHRNEKNADWQRDLVERTKAALFASLFERKSLGDLASMVKVSPFHLCRVFRKHTGMTLHEYKTDLRLRHALGMIEERSTDISRIAYDCGFSSHSHFTSAMRTMFGHTPSALRRTLA